MNTDRSLGPPDDESAGMYVHVPFCLSKCTYCAFSTSIFDSLKAADYIDSLEREIEIVAAHFGKTRIAEMHFDTVYFGGGTPSLLGPKQVRRIINALQSHFAIDNNPEITIEVNPATTDVAGLKRMRDMGVNRASLGVQSLSDADLRLMGRPHTAAEAVSAYSDLRTAGFDNVSVDLIAGFPYQTLQSITDDLHSVLQLGPEHLSVYLLEVKEGSRLADSISRGGVPTPDDDLAALMYEEICRIATATGYEQYEISNFCRPGFRSRHNLKYWQDRDYLGFGVGAHGLIKDMRYANCEHMEAYQQAIERNELPRATVTKLTPEVRFRDALIMGLRLVEGIDAFALGKRYGIVVSSFVRTAAGDLEDMGLITIGDDRIVLTPKGRLLSNTVFARFI